MTQSRAFLLACSAIFAATSLLSSGCKAPSKANIELRKQNQDLRSHISDLDRRHAADSAQIRALEAHNGTLATLPQERLNHLFTVHGIELGRLTGVNDQGELKVYVVPTDDSGQQLKAAGSFVIDAFDLASKGNSLVAHREFSVDEARKLWFGQALLYTYVLPVPWTAGSPPEHSEITLKASFTDALTGRTFPAQKVIQTKASPTTAESR